MASRPGITSHRISFDFYVTPGVKLLLTANFAVFILEAFISRYKWFGGYDALIARFRLIPAGGFPGFRIWQPFTYLFLHDLTYLMHILLHMPFFLMFRREL